MPRSPAFQFYPNDWLSSTHITLMTPAEEGAYIRLLSIAWNSEDCGLPDDDNALSILSRLGEGWFAGSSQKVRQCFYVDAGRLYNKRLLKERQKQSEWLKKSSDAGKKSWQARKTKGQMTQKGWAKVGSEMVQTIHEPKPNSSISSSSSSSNNKPPLPPKGYTDDFLKFYENYPRKIGKDAAWKSWGKRNGDRPPIDQILTAIENQKQSAQWLKDGGEFIPHPATWLNQGRWNDEITKPKSPFGSYFDE